MSFPDGKYAGTVKVGEKGQIVIPKALRDMFGINPGDNLLILGDVEKGIAITPGLDFDAFIASVIGGGQNG